MRDEEPRDYQRFETTSLPLAASLLSQIRGAVLADIPNEVSLDGKRLLVIHYPPVAIPAVRDLVEQFHSRRLVVPLYTYNRVLNVLRDRLKQGDGCYAPR